MIIRFLNTQKNIIKLKKLTKIYFLLLSLSLSGCGGNSSENIPPTVDILNVEFLHTVTDTVDPANRIVVVEADVDDIDGSVSDVNWSILSSHQIDLIDSDTKVVRFNAPLINSSEIDLFVLEIEVTDNQGSKTTNSVDIDLNDDLIIFVPLISAKRGEEVEVNSLIFGRKNKISGLNWTVSNGVEVTLLDANTETVTFLAPSSSTISEVHLDLEVSYMDGSDNQIFKAFVILLD
ncbi:hypothetical protein [uncultured Paraglaciecola sp.]|jgi:hypothetical protein|uniref:hypothetical protein n=1 Tax=uncultured Paraglaciecola sp. TaxID=1765024 RepID=UPI0025FD558E|nr:hypothetical protein [uncultured Paraglaciecola sp.]